jgi:Lon protease-like protein
MYLPSIVPIFPLPNVVLFPGVPLPLHIFEPRYRDMVHDASAGHEIIGMSLLRGDWQRDYEGHPTIFEIGCAGRIVNLERLPDGRFNIVLHGVREFSIQRQIYDKSYRQAEVTWRSGELDILAGPLRAALIHALSRFLAADTESPAHRLLQDPSLTDAMLVNFFAYALELDPLEKQGLLESSPLASRAQRLQDVLEFRLEETRLTLGGGVQNRWH